MANILAALAEKQVISPPKWLLSNCHFLAVTGSKAYGVARADKSDLDIYGFCIPPRQMIFPHLTGAIPGFGTPAPGFDQFEQAQVRDGDTVYDFRVMSIVKYFHLCMGCNPDVLDSLFVPEDCVLHITPVAERVREKRHLFLNRKDIWHAFKGYAKSQLHKLTSKESKGKRAADVAREGFDRKFAYHAVRLLGEAEQLLTTGTMDLRRSSDMLKAIRADGGTPLAEIIAWVESKQAELEAAWANSKLPDTRPEAELQQLLYDCLESHFGSLQAVLPRPDRATTTLRLIRQLIDDSGLAV